MSSFQFLHSKYESQMSELHLHYLRWLLDELQYPTALCESADICMYGKTASSGVESMNHTNNSICRWMAINIVNSVFVLVKKECNHFQRSKSDAWKWDVFCEEKPLTYREMVKLTNIFDKCDTAIFRISKSESISHHIVKICKHSSPTGNIV